MVGYDAAKRIKGRKRHLLVDTLGLLLGIEITPADVPEREGAQALLARVLLWCSWLRLMWVDGGYSGPAFAEWVKTQRPKLHVEVVKRSDDLKGFHILPRRWVVERTFGWLMRHRRLVRDYEKTESSAAAWTYIAMIRIQLRRLAKLLSSTYFSDGFFALLQFGFDTFSVGSLILELNVLKRDAHCVGGDTDSELV